MTKICDNLITERLASSPNSRDALEELCHVAEENNKESFYLAFLDPRNFPYRNKKVSEQEDPIPFLDNSQHRIMREFGIFMRYISIESDISELSDDEITFLRRLQMLAYSQFWECIKVQRSLLSLVNLAAGFPYDPNVLISKK